MATIVLRGTDRKLETSISVCEQINKLKESKADGKTPISINGVLLILEDIRYAIPDTEKDKEMIKEATQNKNDEDLSKMVSDYRKEIKTLKESDTKTKINYNLKLASFICYSMTGKWLKEWAIENDTQELNNILVEELKKVKLIVNPTHYKKLFTFVDSNNVGDKFARHAAIRLIERQMSEALETLNYIK